MQGNTRTVLLFFHKVSDSPNNVYLSFLRFLKPEASTRICKSLSRMMKLFTGACFRWMSRHGAESGSISPNLNFDKNPVKSFITLLQDLQILVAAYDLKDLQDES